MTMALLIAACHDSSSRWAANPVRRIAIIEADYRARKRVEIWRGDIGRAGAAHVAIAQFVGQNYYQVRFAFGLRRGAGCGKGKQSAKDFTAAESLAMSAASATSY